MKFLRWPLLIGILIFYFFTSCNSSGDKHNHESTKTDTLLSIPCPTLKFGLPIDSFSITKGTVKRNENLSNILTEYGVSMVTIDKIARRSKHIFDVRKIKVGNDYCIFQKNDSTAQPRYFIYKNSAIDYYVFELFDSLHVYKGKEPVDTKLKNAYGEIKTSLWNSMQNNGLSPLLALRLNDIFAWSIDFFAIQPGDKYRIIYDELFVDSTSIGIGNIYAVQFNHIGEDNFAFRFYQNGHYDYFDENGQSLRKAFLKAPLNFSRISSRFSNSRLHPILRIRRPHHGVDYAAPKGTPVKSIGDGTVIARSYQKRGGGNYLKIKHNSTYTSVYMHLSGFAKGIVKGKRVKQGQLIGYVGATGLATGPHLDFRIFKNGIPVDPLRIKSPPVEPVNNDEMPLYTTVKDSLTDKLYNINWNTEILANK